MNEESEGSTPRAGGCPVSLPAPAARALGEDAQGSVQCGKKKEIDTQSSKVQC